MNIDEESMIIGKTNEYRPADIDETSIEVEEESSDLDRKKERYTSKNL